MVSALSNYREIISFIDHKATVTRPRLFNAGLSPSSVVCISAVKRGWSLIYFQTKQMLFSYIQNEV
jgi:hypothetical protein